MEVNHLRQLDFEHNKAWILLGANQKPYSPPRKKPIRKNNLLLLWKEVEKLLSKQAVKGKGVYLAYFLVPQQDLTMRPVLDLRYLNKFIKTQHFKMTNLRGHTITTKGRLHGNVKSQILLPTHLHV